MIIYFCFLVKQNIYIMVNIPNNKFNLIYSSDIIFNVEKVIESKNYRKLVKGLGTKKVKQERIWEVDFLRCIPIILVMLYHLCYYIGVIPQMLFSNYKEMIVQYPAYTSFVNFCLKDIFFGDVCYKYLQPFFSGVFLFICGVSSSLTRSNLKRSIFLWIISLSLTGGTYLFSYISQSNSLIVFGVLHVMAFSITVYVIIELIFKYVFKKQVPAILCLAIGLMIFFVSSLLTNKAINAKPWPTEYLTKATIEDLLYYSPEIALGKYAGGSDWFPIFPNSGIIFIGIGFGKALYMNNKRSILPKLYFKGLKPFCFIGSHTIYFYILFPPVSIVILVLILLAMGFKIDFSALL